ncbi:MAG: LysR family transcriptional regulator [Sciscionella sp.]
MDRPNDADFASVELRHLRAFVAVAEEANFTRAASRLRVSQPALSRTIAQLERTTGASLIHRTRHALRLTAAGRRFLPQARRALGAVVEALGAARGQTPRLRVGFTWGSAAEYIAPLVRAFEERHPDVAVEIHRYDETMAGLADGRSHIGFLPGLPQGDRVRAIVLAEELRVAALPIDHPLAGRETLTLTELKTHPLVINVVSGSTSTSLWQEGHRPSTIVRVQNVDEWMEAIAAARGIGLTPASTGRLYSHPKIRYIPLSDAPPVPIVLAWPRSDPHPLAEDFAATASRTHPHQASTGFGGGAGGHRGLPADTGAG